MYGIFLPASHLNVNLKTQATKTQQFQSDHRQLLSHETLTEEYHKLSSAHQQLQDNHQQLTGYCQQLTKDHRQLSEDHHQLSENHHQLSEDHHQLSENHRQLSEDHRQLSEDHHQLSEDHRQLSENHKQLLDTVEGNATTLRDAIQNISELKKVVQSMQPSWSITPSELRMTEERIGGGGWGEVKVGYYHGTKVAVKEMYHVIVSDYNRETFQREMHIASLVRHPNLLLFMGAVTIGNLQIVTEVMEISLRKLLENGHLTPKDISPVAKDVACALNYLHTRPDPIIHRDVSSANVLLNSKQGGWVAKLGDFGSANFLTKTNTQVPGAFIYAAPEARDSSIGPQGPKMDTYSYGVLLLEMCVCRLPDPQVIRSAVGEVSKWSQPKQSIGELAIQCMRQDPDQRPYMATVVGQL